MHHVQYQQIKVEKIKDVIGPGGKVINKIIEETGVKIDIEEDGKVFIYSSDSEKAVEALDMIEDIVRDVEVGGIYYGEVTKIMPFGGFRMWRKRRFSTHIKNLK